MTDTLNQQGQTLQYDALVIGGGIAGLSFCLALLQDQPNLNIALLCKEDLSESNSIWAQGGIASVYNSDDDFKTHITDTLNAGDGLCDIDAVTAIVNAGPKCIQFLEQFDITFDTTPEGKPDLAKEGGHSARRIFHAKDTTGAMVINGLSKAVLNHPQVTVHTYHTAIDLIPANDKARPQTPERIVGAFVLDEKQALVHTMLSPVIVLATGGVGKVFRYSSNSDLATGDGIAMAYRAGASLSNMEFIQFHPTLLYHPERTNFLITEALRGEGAYLKTSDGTERRFMANYAPDKMELATRDVVSRAIFTEIEKDNSDHVYLDARHLADDSLIERFPHIFKTCLQLGIDLRRDMIPVVPGAHYACGGILATAAGKTDLAGLYAIGETAATGLHGANRLASNSLLEATVMALNAAASCQEDLKRDVAIADAPMWSSETVTDLRRASQINAHWRGLRGEMTSYAGVIRTHDGLNDLRQLVRARRKMIDNYYWHHAVTRDIIELRNIILIAERIISAALRRVESRGVHYRADYPKPSPKPEVSYDRGRLLRNVSKEVLKS